MRIVIGYFNNEVEFIGKKYPGKTKSFYFVYAILKKKIAETEEQNPFSNKEINKHSRHYDDDTKLKFYCDKYIKGKFSKNSNAAYFTDEYYNWSKIEKSVTRRAMFLCKKLKIHEDNSYVFW